MKVLSHIIVGGIAGIFLTVLFAEFLFPLISIYIKNREHLLDIQIRELPFLGDSNEHYRVLTLNLENKHPTFTTEDINLNADFSDIIREIKIGADEGVFGCEISKGERAMSEKNTEMREAPSNHRNIKIRKLFPGSTLALSISLDTKKEGNGFFPRGRPDLGSAKYSMEYSYKFWGATVRRKIKEKTIKIRYSKH